jgi:photosystem II stability/assembly factor-like uncharacterized protein
MSRYWNLVRTGAVVLVTALLCGCATQYAVGGSSKPSAREGVVSLRIVSLFGGTLRRLTLENLDNQQEVWLAPQLPLGGDSYRFTGIVPVGRYRTKVLTGQDLSGTQVLTLTIPLDNESNTFEVKGSQLTNLKTIVIAPMGAATDAATTNLARLLDAMAHVSRTTRSFVAPRDDSPVAAREWLAYVNPKLAASINAAGELAWSQPRSEPQQAAERAMVAMAQAGATPSRVEIVDADGRGWAGGKLGLVAELREGKVINRWHTGTVNQILAAAALPDGRLVAVGEEAYVAVSSADRKTWQTTPVPDARAAVGSFVALGPDGRVYLLMRTPGGATVYASDPARIEWKEQRRIESPDPAAPEFVSDRTPLFKPRPVAVITKQRLAIYTPETDELSSYDFAKKSWEKFETPSGFNRIDAEFAGGIIVGDGGRASKYATADYGKTWWKPEGFTYSGMPMFIDRQTGYLLASDYSALSVNPWTLRKTSDGGKTWQALAAEPPKSDGGRLMYDGDQKRLGYTYRDGRRVWLDDDGKTWR